jgi:hypothetical protein
MLEEVRYAMAHRCRRHRPGGVEGFTCRRPRLAGGVFIIRRRIISPVEVEQLLVGLAAGGVQRRRSGHCHLDRRDVHGHDGSQRGDDAAAVDRSAHDDVIA